LITLIIIYEAYTSYDAPDYAVFSSLPPFPSLIKVKVKGKVVPVLNKAPRHEGVLGG
jgi:hypothetical protein